MMKLMKVGSAEELPTKHQLFLAVISAVAIFVVEKIVSKSYVSAFKFLSRRKGR